MRVDTAIDFVVGRSHRVLELILVQGLVARYSVLASPFCELLCDPIVRFGRCLSQKPLASFLVADERLLSTTV